MSNLIGAVLFACGLGVVYLVIYLWGRLFVWRESDPKILHRYQKFFVWGSFTRKKLAEICAKKLDECTTSDEAWKLRSMVPWDHPELYSCMIVKARELLALETKQAIEDARGDEQKLLELYSNVADEFKDSVRDALRPFVATRIKNAKTVEDLVSLRKELLSFSPSYCSPYWWERDRIDSELEGIYQCRLKEFVLREALAASKQKDINNACFLCETDNHVINALVVMKKSFLCLEPQFNSFWTSGPLHKEIDFALSRFLEYYSPGLQ